MSVHADDEHRVTMLLGDVAGDSLSRRETRGQYLERLRRMISQLQRALAEGVKEDGR